MQRPITSFTKKKDDDLKEADANNIEQYLDFMYEEQFETKVKGARMILYLSLDPNNLYNFTSNEQIFSILSRNLKELHSKNMELTIHILTFFYGYSCYETFHPLLIDYGIGEACINIINFQYSKYIIRKDDLNQKYSNQNPEFKKELDKFLFMIRKQDRILRLAFTILINLADDPRIEKKMVKKDVVLLLTRNLQRSNVNLIVILLLFIKKLSIYNINKNELIFNKFVDNLGNLFSYTHQLILSLTLDIIFNLSFDGKFVLQLIERVDIFNQIVSCFKIQNLRGLVLRILYNISKEQNARPLFAETECIYVLYELLIKFPEPKIGAELAALTINLTSNSRNCEILAGEGRINNLLERAFKNNDCYLTKIIKNVIKFSENEDIKDLFEKEVDKFIETLQNKVSSDEFAIELIEILSSVETNWETKINQYGLIEFIETNLEKIGNRELLTKVIMFISNIGTSKVSI